MSVAPRQLLLYVALPFAGVAGTALAAPVATVGEIENPGVIANCSIVAEPNSAYVTPAVTFTSRQTTESIVSFSFYDDRDTLVASDDVTVPVPPAAGVIPPLPRFGQPARFRSLRCAVKVAVVSGSSRSDVPAPADTPSAMVTMPAAPLLPTPIPTSTPVPAPPTTTPMPTITPTPTAVPTTTPRPTATPMPTVTPMPTITPTPKPPSLPVSAAPVITGCSIKQDAGSAESTPLITFQSPPLKPTLVRMSFYDAAGHFAGKQDVLVPLPPATGPTPPLPSFVLTIIYASLRCTEP